MHRMSLINPPALAAVLAAQIVLGGCAAPQPRGYPLPDVIGLAVDYQPNLLTPSAAGEAAKAAALAGYIGLAVWDVRQGKVLARRSLRYPWPLELTDLGPLLEKPEALRTWLTSMVHAAVATALRRREFRLHG